MVITIFVVVFGLERTSVFWTSTAVYWSDVSGQID